MICFCMFCTLQYQLFWNPCFSFDIFNFGLSRLSMVWLCAWISARCLDYQKCKTNNCWCCIDIHFKNVAGTVSWVFWPLKAANISSIDVCNQLELTLPKCKVENCWRSIDAYSQNGALTVLLSLFPRMAAYTSGMHSSDQITSQLPYLQDKTSLTLRWRSFSAWGSDPVAVSSAYESCRYDGYA